VTKSAWQGLAIEGRQKSASSSLEACPGPAALASAPGSRGDTALLDSMIVARTE